MNQPNRVALTLIISLATLGCVADDTTVDTGMVTLTNMDTSDDVSGIICGDSLVEGDEQCDLGPDNSASGQCTPECQIAACGDGYVWIGAEECDDTNTMDGDGCSSKCLNE